MLQLTIIDGPRFNLRGAEARQLTPAGVVRYLAERYPGATIERWPEAIEFTASSATVAPDLTARGLATTVVGLITPDDGEWYEGSPPIRVTPPSVPGWTPDMGAGGGGIND